MIAVLSSAWLASTDGGELILSYVNFDIFSARWTDGWATHCLALRAVFRLG